ncbi:MAG: T9SS type A sorting domain-containing protein [Bacteroidota bacterium]|jgi:hypothetical protein
MKLVKAFLLIFFLVSLAPAQMIKRTDAIWARAVPRGTITLDGIMNEAAWASADSVQIAFGQQNPLPGSGWKSENGILPTDPTHATIKFLLMGDSLILGVFCPDSSVGGGGFNLTDGLLMNLRDRASANRPVPDYEHYYAWDTDTWANPLLDTVGALPGFFGHAGSDKTLWDGKTHVFGVSNSDATPDTGWSTELAFNLDARGYHPSAPQGDIAMFSISIYDADWQWPHQNKASGNRAWLQGPWGNANAYDVMRIHMRSDVTVSSGAVPAIGPELIIPNGANFATPVIDGILDDAVWKFAPHFDVRYGDDVLRATYPSIGPYLSGQFQETIHSVQASVLDPADGTIYYFFKGDTLFLGADVRDQVVASQAALGFWDGVRFTIDDRTDTLSEDHNHFIKNFTVRVDSLGHGSAEEDLPFLRDSLHAVQIGFHLKGGTTVNNPADVDSGFTIELAIDLTKLGYPHGLGDRILFFGATVMDVDVFANPADNYAERAWFFREKSGGTGPAWCFMDPTTVLSVGNEPAAALPGEFAVKGNYPNPFNPTTTIRYAMPEAGYATLLVYDMLGRSVAKQSLGMQQAGMQTVDFNALHLSSGVYIYRLQMTNLAGDKVLTTMYQKMMLIK